MTGLASNEKAGAASTAAGPLDTEFMHPASVDSVNQEPSLEESSELENSCFSHLVSEERDAIEQASASNDVVSSSSLEVWQANGEPILQEPLPSMPMVLNQNNLVKSNNQSSDWTRLVQSGLLNSVRHDAFIHADTVTRNGDCVVLDQIEVTRLINECEALGYPRFPSNELEKQIRLIARINKFDGAQEWLSRLPSWDRKERVKHFLPDYLGTGFSPYFEAVGLYWWTAMVTRILEPGCQVDMVPVIVGRQGLGKSTLLRLLAPFPAYSGEACLTDSPYQLGRKVLGKTLVIWEELSGITGRNDADSVKTFITSRTIELPSSIKRGLDTFDRRFVICATSNRKDFLRDSTGQRRYLPFESNCIDLKSIEQDKLQFWAEAFDIIKMRQLAGKALVDYEDAERLAEAEYEEFMHQARFYGDPDLHQFLNSGADKFSTEQALQAVKLHINIDKWDRNEMAATLRQLGYKYYGDRSVIPGRKPKVWHKPKTLNQLLVQTKPTATTPLQKRSLTSLYP